MSNRFNELYTISEEAMSQEVNGETVILDLKSEQYFGLDETGTRIWQLLNECRGLQEIFDTMMEEYDVEEGQLETDIKNLLAEMVANGLITLK